jgi:endonuclease/exonuclease/phosphatase family metal-dependent hydrolase
VTELVIGTANTFSGALLRSPSGLAPFRDVDLLAVQEVFGFTAAGLAARFTDDGFEVVSHHERSGLALARRGDSAVRPGAALNLHKTLAPERILAGHSDHWRERALIAARVQVGGMALTFANAHLMVFARPIARRRQVQALRSALGSGYFAGHPLILVGDMNHYPAPRNVDRAMAAHSGLARAALDAPTWQIAGSKHEWLARTAGRATGRSIESFDAELDAVLYRGVVLDGARVVRIESDHAGIVARFSVR